MRIAAIDASALGGGSVSAAVEAAATSAEETGGSVRRFRLYGGAGRIVVAPAGCGEYRVRTLEEVVAPVVEAVLDSDGIILGVPATSARTNAATRAFLDGLAASFSGRPFVRGRRGRATRLVPGERLVLITVTGAPRLLATAYASSLGPVPPIRRTFSRAGVGVFRQVSISDMPGHPLARDRALACAADVGRDLAAAILRTGETVPASFGAAVVGAPRLAR